MGQGKAHAASACHANFKRLTLEIGSNCYAGVTRAAVAKNQSFDKRLEWLG